MSDKELLEGVEKLLQDTPIEAELEYDYEGNDVLLQWSIGSVYSLDEFEGYEEEEILEETEGMIELDELHSLLNKAYKFVKRKHKKSVEEGVSSIDEGIYRIRFH